MSDSGIDDLSGSISEEIFLHNEERPQTWSRIDGRFRYLISKNIQCSTVVAFLVELLRHIRKVPIRSRKFASSICFYLFATKNVASKLSLDKPYYNLVRELLTVYSVIQLKNLSCLDDESNLATDILMKITLLMQGSIEIAVADVLIDIDNELELELQSIRSCRIMKLVHRKYLSKNLIGGPVQMEDTEFVKHLILFHFWYKVEDIDEKPTVLKMFLTTIKPSCQLKSNPEYSQYLNSYNDDVADDYKKLILQPFQRESLVQALCEHEVKKWQHSVQATIDLCLEDELVVIGPTNFAEVVDVDDEEEVVNVDDDDTFEINYLSKLYERLSGMSQGANRLISRNTAVELVIISDDSETESVAMSNNSIPETAASPIQECNSQSPGTQSFIISSHEHHPYTRKSDQRDEIRTSSIMKTSYERSEQTTKNKSKKVTFGDPLVSETHVFERYASETNSSIEMEMELELDHTDPSSPPADVNFDLQPSKPRKIPKKKKIRKNRNPKARRTSRDERMKRNRKRIDNMETKSVNSTNSKEDHVELPSPKRSSVRLQRHTLEKRCALQLKRCTVRLQRCTVPLKTYKGKPWDMVLSFIK